METPRLQTTRSLDSAGEEPELDQTKDGKRA
jgi:hypothetical protein